MHDANHDLPQLWNEYQWISRTVRRRHRILDLARQSFAHCASPVERARVARHVARRIDAVDAATLAAQRLRRRLPLGPATPALINVARKLDRLSADLCNLLLAERTTALDELLEI